MSELRTKIEVNDAFPPQTPAAGRRSRLAPEQHVHGPRSVTIGEFAAVASYDRKYANRLPWSDRFRGLQNVLAERVIDGQRVVRTRPVPFRDWLIPTHERYGHLSLTDEIRE